MTDPTFDDLTARAVRILAAAVDRDPAAALAATRRVAVALERALDVRSQAELDRAAGLFDRLDGGVRRRLADRAHDLARTERAAVARPKGRAAVAATGFLGALNHRRTTTPRTEARTRLLADMMAEPGGARPLSPYEGPRPAWWKKAD